MYIGTADTAQKVVARRRSSFVRPSILPLPTFRESKSFQPPGPAWRHHSAARGKSRAMLSHVVSDSPAQ
jgi:hypothetical protein